MPKATPHHPDGSQIRHRGGLLCPGEWPMPTGAKLGDPLEYERPTEDRAFLSAQKSWWAPRSKKKGSPGEPPVGARIMMDGLPFRRYDRVPIRDEAGKIVGTKCEWVDEAAELREAEEKKHLDEMRKKLGETK